jgi:hypothetical protein
VRDILRDRVIPEMTPWKFQTIDETPFPEPHVLDPENPFSLLIEDIIRLVIYGDVHEVPLSALGEHAPLCEQFCQLGARDVARVGIAATLVDFLRRHPAMKLNLHEWMDSVVSGGPASDRLSSVNYQGLTFQKWCDSLGIEYCVGLTNRDRRRLEDAWIECADLRDVRLAMPGLRFYAAPGAEE